LANSGNSQALPVALPLVSRWTPHRECCNSDVDTRHRTPRRNRRVSGCPKRSQRRIRTCNRVNKICKRNTSIDSRSEWLGKGSDRPS